MTSRDRSETHVPSRPWGGDCVPIVKGGKAAAGLALALSISLAGCAELLGIDSPPAVEVAVEPIVYEEIMSLADGSILYQGKAQKLSDIECYARPGQTCMIHDAITVRVINHSDHAVTYHQTCPLPYQRQKNGSWESLSPTGVCAAIGLPSYQVPANGSIEKRLGLYSPRVYDWRSSSDLLRVVLEIRDGEELLPESARTSNEFQPKMD